MGTTEIDHQAIKARIKAILEADTTLFKLADKKGGLVNSISIGLPDGYNWSKIPFDYIVISNDLNFEMDQPFGAVIGTNPTSNISTSMHTIRYMVIMMASGPTTAITESKLDAIHKETKQALKNNVKLTKPSDGTNDLNVIQSICRTSKYVDGGSNKGLSINGIILTLEVKIVTS